jgi:exopolyphosphatase / guanosine-5'-triphosphate,3'-diphosphate pyrophosphatase
MSTSDARVVAAVDIGSNSFQITVARVEDGEIHIIERVKEAVRLAKVIDRTHIIPDEVIDRATLLLSSFRDLALRHGAELRVSATAALRAARNADQFVAQAAEVAQVDVKIISAMDEARLVRQGVRFGLPTPLGLPSLCIDVGGGSTEFSVGCGEHINLVASVPRGALTVHSRFLGFDPVPSIRARKARQAIHRRFRTCVRSVNQTHFENVVATGGTIQRIARIVAALRGAPVQDVDGFIINRSEFKDVVRRLIKAHSQEGRLKIPGMDPTRADVLLGGALIFEALGDTLDIEEWIVSMSALRAGLLTTERWPV